MSDEKKVSCREAVEQLWAFIDGELPEMDQAQVHRHLEACRSCYPHYDFRKAFVEFLRRNRDRPAPPGVRKRVFLRLLAEESRD